MLLKKLIKNIPNKFSNIDIKGLSSNSKEVKRNYIFFAIKGNKTNGEKFIKDAIKKGAAVIICSKNCNFKSEKILIIKKNNIRNYLSIISSKFYKLKPQNIIAVTGTNGKTSIADLFFQIFNLNKIPVGSIGTLGIKYNNKTIKTNLTSPDTISIHKYLDFFKRKKINNVIVEASSHGLDQDRLNNINFKAGIFTNFSQDHLDYHKTMKSYLNAKMILFKKILKKNSVIISDKEINPFNLLKKISVKKKIKLLDITNDIQKIKSILPNLTNDFKIKNLAMTIRAVKICDLKNEIIIKTIKKIKDVNGRLELVKNYPNGIKVFIDYAHTPDALSKALSFLNKEYGPNISLVFGCGGNRDKKKRPLMSKIANNKCKKIYVTDDNPRDENPSKIRNQLARYINKNKCFNIENRSLAIKKAITNAEPKEVILIAGKGHEEKQIYKDKVYYISDKKIVKKLKIKKKVFSKKQISYLQNKSIIKKLVPKFKPLDFNGLSIDSRTVKKDNLFLTIKGNRNDGSKFINEALKKGASAIVTTSNVKKNNKIVRINDSFYFLNQFAKLKRECSIAKIIAITGSAGKTSLKNILKDLLSNYGNTYSSPKSFNNHYGVPVSLSNLNFDDKYGIFEVGMSRSGEIKRLSKLIKPHLAVITNIGEAHLENFKNIRGIAKAKSEIIENIQAGGTIVLNRDDKFFKFLFKKAKTFKLKISTFGKHNNSDICLKKIERVGEFSKIYLKVNNQIFDLKIKDINIYNLLASVAVLKQLGVNINKIHSKIKKLEPSEGRGKKYSILRYKKKFNLIDESYNANPLSVKNAIKKLNLIKKDKFKKYLILGDMLELGPKTKKFHEELSKVINNSDIDKVFVKGKKTIFTYKYLNKKKRGNILQNNEDIDLSLNNIISNNDYLMIKGSNATGLNNFSKKMIKGI